MVHRTAFYCLLGSTSLLAPQVAIAQAVGPAVVGQSNGATPDAAESQEIIVTARRTSERLQDVPVAVSSISGELLERQNIVQAQDLQRIAPSLTVTPTARGTSTPQYGIRGQRAGTPTMLIDPAVGVYFAEVGQSRSGGGNATLYDLESVQVLRGPQGVLFGRNNTGGAVLITPRAPSDVAEGYVEARIGNFGLFDIEGVVNLPIDETLAVRVAARSVRRDGYFRSVTTGQEAFDQNNQNLRVSLRWSPTASLTSTTIFTYFIADEAGSMVKPVQINPAAIANPALRALVQADFDHQQTLGFYENAQGSGVENHRTLGRNEVAGVQNITALDLSDTVRLRNIIGWRDIKVDYCIDALGTAPHLQRYCGIQDTEQFSNELQLHGELGGLNLVAGLFYFRESGDEINRNPGNIALGGASPPLSMWADSAAVNSSYAVFGHGTYGLTNALSVSAGLRWTWDRREVEWHNRQEVAAGVGQPRRIVCRMDGRVTVSPSPFTTPTDATNNIRTSDRDLCTFDASASFNEPTWSLSLDYKLSPRNMVYVAQRRGYRAGGFTSQPGNGAAGNLQSPTTIAQRQPFLPELIDDIEIGSKNVFDIAGMRSTLNLAAYHGWYSDVQRVTQQVINNAVVAVTVNAAKATIWGLEAEWSIQPHKQLQLNGGYSLTRARYKQFNDSYNTGTPTAPVLTVVDISDARFGFTPEHQVNVSATWYPPVPTSIGDASVSLSYYYQSEIAVIETATSNCGPNGRYGGCANADTNVDGYGLLNLRADLRDAAGVQGLDLSLFVTNLIDRQYYAFGTAQLGAPFGLASQGVGAPRMWGVGLRYAWGN